jgi:hypothetical protein
MSLQEIIAYTLVIIAVVFLAKKLFFSRKNKGCNGGAGCKCG